ncbi:MAG: hypothetical protein IPJ07_16250 [Acidobacteria bacterium]|nr:hypothetical protein [Acidobacteriota bacterium]
MTLPPLLEKLSGGDRRSIGRSNEVVAHVIADTKLFDVIFDGIMNEDPLIRMRCADAVEKSQRFIQNCSKNTKRRSSRFFRKSNNPEVRWHIAQMFSRLKLNRRDRRRVYGILQKFLSDRNQSSIVRTFSMQALTDLAAADVELRLPITHQIEELTATGTPAMKSRGKRLLKVLKSK